VTTTHTYTLPTESKSFSGLNLAASKFEFKPAKPASPKKEPVILKLEEIAKDKEALISCFKEIKEGKKLTAELLQKFVTLTKKAEKISLVPSASHTVCERELGPAKMLSDLESMSRQRMQKGNYPRRGPGEPNSYRPKNS